MNRSKVKSVIITTGCAAALAAVAVTGRAGPEQIAYPAGWDKWELYATVDRYDSKQYRELYTSPEAVKAVREGKPIPDGTVIAMAIHAAKRDAQGNPVKDANGRFVKDKLNAVTVMEKRPGWGAAVPEEWRNGDWQYASFTADGKPNQKANANIKNCFVCHKPHEKQDYVISLAQLTGKFPTGPVAMKSGMNDVNVANFAFAPVAIKVAAGQTITWTNVDDSPHQVTVQGASTLRTPVILKGESTSLVFNDAGSYGYICGLHPNMKGTIDVQKP
ncbi:MAG: cytochrome P460 family protein [Betaproteobacteria bacterium]|nr:cytochrome P460 family protein [Betaproteobacteria bacterium]